MSALSKVHKIQRKMTLNKYQHTLLIIKMLYTSSATNEFIQHMKLSECNPLRAQRKYIYRTKNSTFERKPKKNQNHARQSQWLQQKINVAWICCIVQNLSWRKSSSERRFMSRCRIHCAINICVGGWVYVYCLCWHVKCCLKITAFECVCVCSRGKSDRKSNQWESTEKVGFQTR